jgi:hypothetical protein
MKRVCQRSDSLIPAAESPSHGNKRHNRKEICMRSAWVPVVIALFACAASSVGAQWIPDGIPVCAAIGLQWAPIIVTDDAGGAIVAWTDQRISGSDVYAQRIDSEGHAKWSVDGVPVFEGAGFQTLIWAVPDGADGAVILWANDSFEALFAQRIDGNGELLWAAGGVDVGVPPGNKDCFRAVPDGSGGALFLWLDRRSGNWDVYAQRIDGAGSVRWAANGVPVCANTSDQALLRAVADGAGGAFVAWCDRRDGKNNVYAQRMAGDGSLAWDPDGIAVCSYDSGRDLPNIIADGSGGAIVAWRDYRVVENAIYAQKLDASGFRMWSQEGELVYVGDTQFFPEMTSDGARGAVIVWIAWDGGSIPFVAQRLDANGAPMWATEGVTIGAANGYEPWLPMPIALVPDGVGGCIVGWMRYIEEATDIYVQHAMTDGSLEYGSDGMPLCAAPNNQRRPFGVSDGGGGAIITWWDARNDQGDIYASRIVGTPGPLRVALDIRPGSCPNPLNPKSGGVLPAAIFGTADLEVRDIDPSTIELGGVPPLRWCFGDAGTPPAGESECLCAETGGDGFVDLTLKFDVPELVAKLGEVEPGQIVTISITGALYDGTTFEGEDCIRIVGEGPKRDEKNRYRLRVAVASSPKEIIQHLSYILPEQSAVEIAVYDVAGRLVQRLESAVEGPGTHTRDWNTSGLASGVYFCRVRASAGVETAKIVLLR